ncbi:phosphoribosyltransferase family protein [Providencia alcalifaciens]|uniref:DNA utilization protein GntX n=1 Tax=Providencia alcalifaciens TaxID=126385 RepID=A0AAW9VD46_9GAMM|nr:phosphoribosyltransferase family protein [Providencia alcalifaciens]EKT63422.1 periplasmic gluconate-binding protein in GNT I transport system [Providencia alcalifaciens Dmel2]MTC35651.1 DNA utilization protein GntX [Providencia alcalifaciens]HEF8784486.1 DNA utilization protein GntX [Providencia alcalifaciens]
MLAMEGVCWLCQQELKVPRQGICSFCTKNLPPMPRVCPQCALTSEYIDASCGRCLLQPPPWQKLITVSPYRAPLRQLIHQYKFHRQPQLAVALTRLFLIHWLNGYRQQKWKKPDMLITIPPHPRRCWRRGFDHMALMGSNLATWLNIAYSQNSLRRSRDTLAQVSLTRKQRRNNLKKAFALETSVSGLHIAIIDDVITTGATMHAAAQLLICAGAHTVDAWSLCRTL